MSTQRSTVVAVFEDRHHADKAVTHLLNAGFRQEEIGVAMRHDEKANGAHAAADSTDTGSHAGSGAIAGVMTGLGLGTLGWPRGTGRGHPGCRPGDRGWHTGRHSFECGGRCRHRWPGRRLGRCRRA